MGTAGILFTQMLCVREPTLCECESRLSVCVRVCILAVGIRVAVRVFEAASAATLCTRSVHVYATKIH